VVIEALYVLHAEVSKMKKIILLGFVVLIAGCDPADPFDSAVSDAGAIVDATTIQDANLTSQVCQDNCGTFTMNSGQYDCPVACPLSQTCNATKHKCCVEIQNKLDLFCKYYPYYNSTFTDAGSTPADSSATRIPSLEEVGFLYCSYPGFVNCKQL
jgi:hypothetical protein